MNKDEKVQFKSAVIAACRNLLNQKVKDISGAIGEAQEAANNEQKSTAGDKHEVGKSMSQRTVEMLGNQLKELELLITSFDKINPELNTAVGPGAIVKFNGQFVFISKGIGKVSVNEISIMTVSTEAPLYLSLKHKKEGDTFLLNQIPVSLEMVF